jgi:hypothetical protein
MREDKQQAPWFVLNCHLQAGKEGKRRLRQIQEGTKAIITLANKLRVKDPASNIHAIICGDFNGGIECGAVRFLEEGFVDASFLEDGEQVSSNRKELPMKSPLQDVMSCTEHSPPPTMVVARTHPQLVQGGDSGYENPILSPGVVDRLKRIYNARASQEDGGAKNMSRQDVHQWLVDINGQVGRGDEYREAARQMGWTPPHDSEGLSADDLKKRITLPENGVLTLEGFIAVYQRELNGGKFWE